MTSWRENARRTVEKVVLEVGIDDKGRLKRALFAAYPFGERKHHPYKIWCEEVKKVLKPTVQARLTLAKLKESEKTLFPEDTP